MLKLILTLRILCGLWAYDCTDTGLPANKPVKGTLIFIHKIFINGPTLASSFSVFSKKQSIFLQQINVKNVMSIQFSWMLKERKKWNEW